MVADYGRSACYEAEREAFPNMFSPSAALKHDAIIMWVKHIHETFWDKFATKNRRLPNILFTKRGMGADANGFYWRLRFGKKGASIYVVIHELAHLYAPKLAHHSAAWRKVYVELIRGILGDEPANKLVSSFAARGLSLDKDGPVRRKRGPNRKILIREVQLGDRVSTLVTAWTLLPRDLLMSVPKSYWGRVKNWPNTVFTFSDGWRTNNPGCRFQIMAV